MSRGQNVDIDPPEDRPFPYRGQNVGHITGTPRQDPPKADGVSTWPRR